MANVRISPISTYPANAMPSAGQSFAGAGAVQRYGGIPPYAETRAYVTKILGLLGGAGELPVVGGFEVRLVE